MALDHFNKMLTESTYFQQEPNAMDEILDEESKAEAAGECSGKMCTANEHCCKGHVCVDNDESKRGSNKNL